VDESRPSTFWPLAHRIFHCRGFIKEYFSHNVGRSKQVDQGPIFRTFFPGENSAENFPPKMLRKNGIFRGKSLEKSFFQEIPWNFPRKKCTKNWPQIIF
jgi:hypothetical protein